MQGDQEKEQIKRAIVEAIVFFDIFGASLTAWELWQSIGEKVSFTEFLDVLENNIPESVAHRDNLYFLKGKDNIVEKRREQFDLSERKSRIARRAARILRFVNGVKMVAICNNFYYKLESDIDLFIVIKPGRIWFSRFLITILIHLFGLRRHGKRIADRICLSFYATDNNLDLGNIALPEADPYMNFWIKYLRPIYNDGVYEKFFQENSWVKDRLPNVLKQNPVSRELVLDNIFSKAFKGLNGLWFDSFIGNVLEKLSKKVQLNKMSYNKVSVSKENDTRVIISDDILKFHENDRRQEIKDNLHKKLRELHTPPFGHPSY